MKSAAAGLKSDSLTILVRYKSKKDGKDQEMIQSSTTPDPGYHMGKLQKYNKHHQQEPRGQAFPSR